MDLSPLLSSFPRINGWYNIMNWVGKCRGQIKVMMWTMLLNNLMMMWTMLLNNLMMMGTMLMMMITNMMMMIKVSVTPLVDLERLQGATTLYDR